MNRLTFSLRATVVESCGNKHLDMEAAFYLARAFVTCPYPYYPLLRGYERGWPSSEDDKPEEPTMPEILSRFVEALYQVMPKTVN